MLSIINNTQTRLLADSYFYGDGKQQNQTEALRLYLIAAENGDTVSQEFLTICLDNLKLSLKNIEALNTQDWFADFSV